MKVKRILVASFAMISLIGTTGCSALSEKAKLYDASEEKLESVERNLWQLSVVWPWNTSVPKLREHMMKKARRVCEENQNGAQMLDSIVRKRVGQPGTEGMLVFRCVNLLPRPEKPFIDHSSSVS